MKEKKSKKLLKDRGISRGIISFLLAGLLFTLIIAIVFSYVNRIVLQSSGIYDNQNEREFENHYVLIVNDSDRSLWQEIYESMKRYAEEEDSYVELQVCSASDSLSATEMINKCIVSAVDGIILQNTGEPGITEMINKASSAGIPVVTILNDASESERISYVGINVYSLGLDYANELMSLISTDISADNKNDISVVFFLSDPDENSNQSQIFIQTRNSLLSKSKYKDVLNIDSVDISVDILFNVNKLVSDFLKDEKDMPDYIICLDTTTTDIVYQSLVDYNLLGETRMIGYHKSDAMKQALTSDTVIATLVIDSDQMARCSIEALTDYKELGYNNIYYGVPTSFLTKEGLEDE